MKSYQELIEERKKELMRGATTSTTSAPKALSVAEAIEKRKQELARDVTTSVPAAAASAPSGVLDPVERARRLAEGIPLDPVEGDNPDAPSKVAPNILESLSNTAGDGATTFLKGVKGGIGALVGGINALGTLPVAAGIDAVTGGTEAVDFAARNFVDPGYRMSAEDAPTEGSPLSDKVLYGLGRFGPDLAAMAATRGASAPFQAAATTLPRVVAGQALKEAAEMSLLPSVSAGANTAREVVEAGGSAPEAFNAALTDSFGNSIANALPIAAVGNKVVRALTGAGTGIAGDATVNSVTNTVLPDSMQRPLFTPESLILSGGIGGTMGVAFGQEAAPSTPIEAGAAQARETLQTAGAYADGSKKATDSSDTRSSFVPDPAINAALSAGQKEGEATTPPATTQKAPVAPPVKPQGQVSREASVAAGQRILADLKTDPTLGVPEADRPRVLHERTKVYEAQEQAKLDGPKEVAKTLKLVRDIGKTVRTEPNILAGVEAPTSRILTNVTKGIAPLSATELAVRKMASEGRAPIIQQTGQPLQNAVPVAAPTTTKAQDQKAALGIVKRIGREANATPALPVGLEASTNQIVSGITKGIEPLSTTEQFVRKMVRDAPAPRAPAPPAPFDPATARFPEQPSSVEQTASMPQRIRVGGRFAPKGVVGTASTQPRGNITQGVPIVQSATLGEASTTIGATKALEAVEPIRVTQPEQQSQQGETTNGMQGQEEGRRDSSNQEVTDNAPVVTGQAGPSMRGATNARAAMLRVSGSLESGVSSELRRTANELKNSPNTQDTKVVVMTAEEAVAEGSPLRKVDADGTVTAGKAAYGRNGDTIYLQEDATTEDVVHETVHAATVKSIAAVEQGAVNDPESTLALENLKAAVNRLGEITAADLPGVPADIVARIQYAARNPQEAVAVLRSSPETARALRDSKITVDVKADRKTKIPVKMPIWKAIVNSIASIVGKQVFKTQHRDQVVRTVERMLLADSVIQSSKTLERTDVRGIKMSDVKAGDAASRLTGTDAKRGVAPTKTDNAPPNPALPKALQDIPRGLPGLVDKILPKIQRLVSYKMGASPTVYSMVRDNIGGRNFKDWQTENLLSETRDAMRKSLGKRADMYNDELVKALKGQSNTLPAEAKAAVASVRLLIDSLTIKAMALGAMSPNNIVSAIKRIGSYVHDDYKAWKMGPGEWQSLQESPRGDGSNNAADQISSVLPKMMQDIALPADAQLDALGALAQGKGKTAKKRAQAELDIMLGRYGFTQANATVDQQVAFLKKARDSFTEESFREHAAELARKLMNPKGIVLDESMPFKPFSVDATGLKNKTKVPEWQKELWGKYEEYDAIVINTVRMLGGIVDKFASLEGYKQQLIDEGTIVQNKVPHGYTVLKDNDPLVYGPLNGYAIRDRDVALVGALAKQGVQGASAFLQGLTIGGAFGDALSKASSLSKIQAIVLAPDAWLFNATSTVMVGTLASGHPLAIAQHGIKAADFASREAFAGMGRTTKAVETDIQKVFEILFKRGVMGDSALAQDLRSDLAERVIDEAYKDAPAAKRMWHSTKSGAQGVADFGGRGLAFGDTMGKMLSVYVRVPYLRNIYPNKTWDEILTIAADETADSLPSMSRSIPILKAMGRQGVFMPFAGYFAETFRNTAADLGLGFKYQLMGLKALSEGNAKEGTAAALYGTMIHAGNIARHGIVWAVHSGITASIYGMYQLALTAFGDDDEEPDDEAKKISAQVESARAIMEDPEKYKAFREMVPDEVMGDVVPLREIEPGVFSFTTTQRLDMYTTGSALTALERGGWDKPEAWQDAGVAMLSPFNQYSLVAKPVVDLLKGKEGAEWDLAASLLIPAPVKRADRITKAAEKGYEMTPFEKSMHMGGMTVSFVDVKQELANKMQGLASDVNDKMRAVTDSLDPNRKDVTERYTSTNKFSEEFSQAILAQAQMFKEFAPVIERAKGFGLSTQDIVAAAKLNGVSLSDIDLIGILDGEFTPTSAAKVITQKWQTELKAASQNPRQSARVNAYYKAALEDAKKVDEAALIMLKSEGMDVRGQQE